MGLVELIDGVAGEAANLGAFAELLDRAVNYISNRLGRILDEWLLEELFGSFRLHSGDMHSDLLGDGLELWVLGYEVCFRVELKKHTYCVSRVNIRDYGACSQSSVPFFGGDFGALGFEKRNGLLLIATSLFKRGLTLHD